jgi:hypothetical protein
VSVARSFVLSLGDRCVHGSTIEGLGSASTGGLAAVKNCCGFRLIHLSLFLFFLSVLSLCVLSFFASWLWIQKLCQFFNLFVRGQVAVAGAKRDGMHRAYQKEADEIKG